MTEQDNGKGPRQSAENQGEVDNDQGQGTTDKGEGGQASTPPTPNPRLLERNWRGLEEEEGGESK
jgi:hypothetical protein